MKKRRRLILLISAALVLIVLVVVVLVIGNHRVTSYGTATSASSYAPEVKKMVTAQQQLADAFEQQLMQQSDSFTNIEESFDHQSAASSSYIQQINSPSSCGIGRVRYMDVLNLSLTAPADYQFSPADLLKSAVGSQFGPEAKVSGTTVRFPKDHFRIDTSLVSEGSRFTYRFTVPNLADGADKASYTCYLDSQIPLSSIQQLG